MLYEVTSAVPKFLAMMMLADSYCITEAIWIIKNVNPRLKRPFAYEKSIFENLGRYALYLVLKKNKLAQTNTNIGQKHSASPRFINEPLVVFTRINMATRDANWPSRSIIEDF